jgi:predicted TIM-barrel fold metal-dependent hydrolase
MKSDDVFQSMVFAGRPIDNCPVIDAHGHLGNDAALPLYASSPESVISVMDRIGIDVVCASPHLVLSAYAREGNDICMAAVRKYPARIFGYMTANMRDAGSVLPELERCLKAGMRAIKIHSKSGPPYSHLNYDVLYRFANANRLPILAHTEGKEIDDLESNFAKYPDVNFILAHAGCLEREKYARVAAEYPNVYLETCVSQCFRGLIEYFVKAGLADKILWGTDMTFIAAEHQIGRVIFADISEADKMKILGQNAQKVLKIHESS